MSRVAVGASGVSLVGGEIRTTVSVWKDNRNMLTSRRDITVEAAKREGNKFASDFFLRGRTRVQVIFGFKNMA